ncbi:flagellar basal-body rod protein FlgG [Clostridium kluyveri]|uniref:flagellar basal-body rod protein FlgG n=1 Tax=Clostridium kluyveri TaxID=1534 RepID=UPI0022460055|nr:flagellar basal-body rod protein FlgG [Clostridium kluyveri]UZQ50857.1 flagellar hook-basal body complex protein [Clostridium kluyveri]
MIRSFYTAVSGMIVQEAKQDVITNNLANVNTVGFKQDNLKSIPFNEVLIQNYDKVVNGKNVRNVIGSMTLGSEIDSVDTGFTQGTIESTDVSTDFAIDGRGFFTVRREDGNEFYTRDGHFHVNTQGILVDDSGNTVIGRDNQTGALGAINVGDGDMTSDAYGNISIDGNERYKIYTVDFNDYNALTKVGDNLYTGENAAEINTVVKQKSLEKSNVNLVNTMSDLITTMRTFETDQKVVQSIDGTLDKLINETGKV